MSTATSFENQSYELKKFHIRLSSELQKARVQFPSEFPKKVDVLEAADANVTDQWEERLHEAKSKYNGARVILIPYYLRNSHWIGILLEFKANEEIKRAEFIDSVKHSSFDPSELQKRFIKVHPNGILRSRNLLKQDDYLQSAELTIQNLIEATKQGYSKDEALMSTEFSYHQTNNLSTSTSIRGNDLELYPSQQLSTRESDTPSYKESSNSSVELPTSTEQRIELYENASTNIVSERTGELTDVDQKELSKEEEYEKLKKELQDGLEDIDLKSTVKLKQRILEKKQEIESLEKENKHRIAQKRKNSLSQLERLQFLADKLEHTGRGKRIEPTEHSTPSSTNVMIELTAIERSKVDENPVTVENLKNLYTDFSSMPICAERSIITLLFYASHKLVRQPIVYDDSINVPTDIETVMLKELKCLEDRLQVEEIGFFRERFSLKEISTHIKTSNWKDIVTVMKKLLKQIRPLDINELLRLVEKANDAAELTHHKDLILFLGGTGSGKSTIIHFLAGSKMIEQDVAGLDHIAPTEIRNRDLLKITTTPFTKSETRYITPVIANFKDVGAFTNGSIILCDSPGFGDTNGAEVDIANGLGIVRAIKECKSVKPVILNSSKGMGDKCEGIKKLAYVLVGLIPDISDHLKSFSYIFTKYPKKEGKTIHAYFKNINETLNDEEKSDISFTSVLKDMLTKTRRGAQVLDPINDCPGEILDDLAEGTFIDHPKEAFRFSITKESKSIVQEHVAQDRSSISSAIKRNEYQFIKYKLDRLKCLNELLDLDYIKEIYNECVRDVSAHLTHEYQESTSAITRAVTNQISLNEEDIEQYQTRIKHAKLAEDLRKKHLGVDTVHSDAFLLHLNRQIDLMLDNLNEKDINDSSVKTSLDKAKCLLNSFSDLEFKKYQITCQLFVGKVELVINTFKNAVLSNDFDTSANNLTKLSDAVIILQDHLNNVDLKRKYVESTKYFVKYLNDSTDKLAPVFNKQKLQQNDIDSLNSCVCMLESVDKTFALQRHISKETITEIYNSLISKILDYVEEISKKINIELKNENVFHILETYMTEFDLVRTIPVIQLKTSSSYGKVLEKLVLYVYQARRTVEEQLRILFGREGKVDYDKLIKCLSNLKSAKWIETYRSGVYSDTVNDIEEKLIEHIKMLKESAMEVNLDLDNFDRIEQAYKLVAEINKSKS